MELREYCFDEVSVNYDKKRVPLSGAQREKRKGDYRYYGAQGVIDYIDDYIFNGNFLLIAEDGENLKSKKQNIAQVVNGQFWVNNHAHIVTGNELCDTNYLCYLINSMDLSGYVTGSAQPKLSQANLNAVKLLLPQIEVQKKIVDYLRKIDEKIELNMQINENLCDQMKAIYLHAKKSSIWNECKLGEILTFYDHMRKPLSSRQREGMVRLYPYYGATSVVDYVDAYIFDGVYILISEDGANVVDALGHPLIQYTYGKFWVNNHAHIVQGNMFYSEALLFALL